MRHRIVARRADEREERRYPDLKRPGVLDAATKSLTADPQMANIDNLKDLALSVKDLKPGNVTFVTMPGSFIPVADIFERALAEPQAARTI